MYDPEYTEPGWCGSSLCASTDRVVIGSSFNKCISFGKDGNITRTIGTPMMVNQVPHVVISLAMLVY